MQVWPRDVGLRLIDFKLEYGRLWEDEDLHVVAELELFQHLQHAAVELGAHAVALVGAVEPDPGDAVDHIVGDGLGLGAGIGLGGLGHLHHPRA